MEYDEQEHDEHKWDDHALRRSTWTPNDPPTVHGRFYRHKEPRPKKTLGDIVIAILKYGIVAMFVVGGFRACTGLLDTPDYRSWWEECNMQIRDYGDPEELRLRIRELERYIDDLENHILWMQSG